MINEKELELKIKEKTPAIRKALIKGNHIEIHPSRDGIKVLSVGKKILK